MFHQVDSSAIISGPLNYFAAGREGGWIDSCCSRPLLIGWQFRRRMRLSLLAGWRIYPTIYSHLIRRCRPPVAAINEQPMNDLRPFERRPWHCRALH
jgi:hypothetical protein